MSSKRAHEDTSAAGGDGDDRKKKARHGGFRVGPDNLPDGTWRRKGERREDILALGEGDTNNSSPIHHQSPR